MDKLPPDSLTSETEGVSALYLSLTPTAPGPSDLLRLTVFSQTFP